MPRPRSAHTATVKAKLIARLEDGFHAPGQRFFSNRAVAERFGVSYQTAHRLVEELVREGRLKRRASRGTFVAGNKPARAGRVVLVFHPRAATAGSFGAHLLRQLQAALGAQAAPFAVDATHGRAPRLGRHDYPVTWELPEWNARWAEARRRSMMLHARPAPGLGASWIDSVATDDFSGGVCAAQLLRERTLRSGGFAMLAGPATDARSRRRAEGFRTVLPEAAVFYAPSWYREAGEALAARVRKAGPAGVFAANDRLAEGFLAACAKSGRPAPALVGYDNAPVAEQLNLTTIALPWEDMAALAAEIAARQASGEPQAARHIDLALRPVVRLSG